MGDVFLILIADRDNILYDVREKSRGQVQFKILNFHAVNVFRLISEGLDLLVRKLIWN